MKKRFPNVRAGTLDPNLPKLVKKFAGGVNYRVVKDEIQQNYGSTQVPVGRVSILLLKFKRLKVRCEWLPSPMNICNTKSV